MDHTTNVYCPWTDKLCDDKKNCSECETRGKYSCQYHNERCLCQWCEDQCNNGLNCHDCNYNGRQVHDIYMCTGFRGTYPWGTHFDEIQKKAEELSRV